MMWKRLIKVTAVVASLIITSYLVGKVLPVAALFYVMNSGMNAGRQYMDSLTDTDIQRWIERSKEYLAHANPQEDPIGAVPVPDDLKNLGIRRIDLWPDHVVYVWVGGLDHTSLSVKQTDGGYVVFARYNDETGKVIWPRGANE